jgi:hypothetical protein
VDEITPRIKAIGARRKRLRDELAATDSELRDLMPLARAVMTQEEIRTHTGLSIPTMRAWV